MGVESGKMTLREARLAEAFELALIVQNPGANYTRVKSAAIEAGKMAAPLHQQISRGEYGAALIDEEIDGLRLDVALDNNGIEELRR